MKKVSEEHTGLSSNYYVVPITNPTTKGMPNYTAECNDIIEALDMNFAEANVFKALWRRCAARTLGKHKKGNNELYDAEKIFFFSERILSQTTVAVPHVVPLVVDEPILSDGELDELLEKAELKKHKGTDSFNINTVLVRKASIDG